MGGLSAEALQQAYQNMADWDVTYTEQLANNYEPQAVTYKEFVD